MGESKEKKAKRKKAKINGQEYVTLHIKVRPYLDKNGNRKEYKTFYGKTLKECKEKADKFNADDRIKAKEMFFGELVEDYIKNTSRTHFCRVRRSRNGPSSAMSMPTITTWQNIKSPRGS